MRALGINIFGGGFTLGAMAAGYDIAGQWEECDAGAKTFDLNAKYFGRVPRPLRYGDWPRRQFLSPGAPALDLVYANPPCAPWSSANVRKTEDIGARLADPRLEMTARTMATALTLRPRAFVCESVSEAFTRGREYYDSWAKKWMTAGYGVTYLLTDAILHGLPSERRRFHFIAHRHELKLAPPDMKNFFPATVRMAIGDLNDRFGHVSRHAPRRQRAIVHELIGKCPPGGKLREVDRMFSFMARRLYWDSPALTIAGMHLVAHPERARYITVREGLRLCSYPDDFITHETSGHASSATQAVMPAMGKFLGELLKPSGLSRARAELRVADWRDLAKPYRQQSVLAGLDEKPGAPEVFNGPAEIWQELDDSWHAGMFGDSWGSAENMTEAEARECLAANWPEAFAEEPEEPRQVAPRRAPIARAAGRRAGSGQRFRELILAGQSNADALARVREEFPQSKATLADAAWNRRELTVHPDQYGQRGERIKGRGPRLAGPVVEEDLAG